MKLLKHFCGTWTEKVSLLVKEILLVKRKTTRNVYLMCISHEHLETLHILLIHQSSITENSMHSQYTSAGICP